MRNDLTQEELKRQLSYDPQTGLFTRLVANASNVRIGDIAGTDDGSGYTRIRVHKIIYPAHRLAFLYMTGAFPLEQVDHQNGIRDDNRWINLRAVSFEENRRNHKTQRNNTSGVPGVSWDNKISRWVARIGAGGKRVVLGTFDDFEKAIEVRLSAELEYEYHPNHGRRVDGGKNGASY